MRQALRNFFFPPAGSPWWLRLLPYAVLGVLTFFVLVGSVYAWDYTNSPQFCGESCHTMPPEYTAYLLSPHAEVDCVECHIGRGFFATRVSRKAGDLEHVFDTTFHNYEFPIRAKKMRPASETCEKCHSPQKFSDDSLREIRRFDDDLNNTALSTFLVLKTGGGTAREGLGRGIHWHIENPVHYYATDELDQEIPYVRVTNEDGTTTEFVDITANLDTSAIAEEDLKQMDCITCHNRITHLILTPENTVDQMMSRGQVSSAIPEIRAKAVEVYGGTYPTVEAGQQALAGLKDYYRRESRGIRGPESWLGGFRHCRLAGRLRQEQLPRAAGQPRHPSQQYRSQGLAWVFPLPRWQTSERRARSDPPRVQSVPLDPGRRRPARLSG